MRSKKSLRLLLEYKLYLKKYLKNLLTSIIGIISVSLYKFLFENIVIPLPPECFVRLFAMFFGNRIHEKLKSLFAQFLFTLQVFFSWKAVVKARFHFFWGHTDVPLGKVQLC